MPLVLNDFFLRKSLGFLQGTALMKIQNKMRKMWDPLVLGEWWCDQFSFQFPTDNFHINHNIIEDKLSEGDKAQLSMH
jgi:hypothetical protein